MSLEPIPAVEVQCIGRWKSLCYATYIRPELLTLNFLFQMSFHHYGFWAIHMSIGLLNGQSGDLEGGAWYFQI